MNENAKQGLLLYPDADDPESKEEHTRKQVLISLSIILNLGKLEETNSQCSPQCSC